MEEKNNYNLFNFDGMSEVANNLIDKLASATGWYVSRNTPSKIGLNTYIEEIQKKNYDPLTKAALITNAKKNYKRILQSKRYCINRNQFIEQGLCPGNVG